MYQKKKPFDLQLSASPVVKNFAALTLPDGKIRAAIVHKNRFNLITFTENDTDNAECNCDVIYDESQKENGLESEAMHTITQIKWVQTETFTILVVTTHRGFQIYNSDGTEVLYSNTFPLNPNECPLDIYTQGIASLNGNQNQNLLYIGTHNGSILSFNIMWTVENTLKVSVCENIRIYHHKSSITDLCSDKKEYLVSSDDIGTIIVWKSFENSELKNITQFDGFNGFACTGICLYNEIICASYGSGHIRLFDFIGNFLMCEISAHSKWITALDMTQDGHILSVSEDSFIRVWKFDSEKSGKERMTHLYGTIIQNTMLFGGGFINSNGNSFCTVGYDSLEVQNFVLQE